MATRTKPAAGAKTAAPPGKTKAPAVEITVAERARVQAILKGITADCINAKDWWGTLSARERKAAVERYARLGGAAADKAGAGG